jgi:hypothetical protein
VADAVRATAETVSAALEHMKVVEDPPRNKGDLNKLDSN